VGFIAFFKWAFKKMCFFLVGSNYINLEDDYGRLIDFLSQISKLSCFNVLDLPDFTMHHYSFRFVFCAITVAHLCLP